MKKRRKNRNIKFIVAGVFIFSLLACILFLKDKTEKKTTEYKPYPQTATNNQPLLLYPRDIKQVSRGNNFSPRRNMDVNINIKTNKRETDIETQQKIAFHPKKEKIQKEGDISYVSIIVDDMGINAKGTEEILSLNYPLTLAIIPGLPMSQEIAERAKYKNFEIIVHLPLEAENEKYNRKIPPITTEMEEDEIKQKTEDAFKSIPYAVGFNNHQGSKATSCIRTMRQILKVAKENNFFYIDSLTSPYSVGEMVAKGIGIKSGKRDVFLDNIEDKEYIRKQMKLLADIAKKKGTAIGICHVSPITADVLREELPKLAEQNIKIVPAGEIVR